MHARLRICFWDSSRRAGAAKRATWGGGRPNSLSVNETIDLLDQAGCKLNWKYEDKNRTGDLRRYFVRFEGAVTLPQVETAVRPEEYIGETRVLSGGATAFLWQPRLQLSDSREIRFADRNGV